MESHFSQLGNNAYHLAIILNQTLHLDPSLSPGGVSSHLLESCVSWGQNNEVREVFPQNYTSFHALSHLSHLQVPRASGTRKKASGVRKKEGLGAALSLGGGRDRMGGLSLRGGISRASWKRIPSQRPWVTHRCLWAWQTSY